eukprot:3939616-Prymnesium_polylepis.1
MPERGGRPRRATALPARLHMTESTTRSKGFGRRRDRRRCPRARRSTSFLECLGGRWPMADVVAKGGIGRLR